MSRGYYGIALFEPKTTENLGTVMRSAMNFNADFICTIGNRYRKMSSDTTDSTKHIPLYHYEDWGDFKSHTPQGCDLVFVEVTGKKELPDYNHPERAIYILGGEDRTIPEEIMKGHQSVKVDTNFCLNLAVTASIAMYDRQAKK